MATHFKGFFYYSNTIASSSTRLQVLEGVEKVVGWHWYEFYTVKITVIN